MNFSILFFDSSRCEPENDEKDDHHTGQGITITEQVTEQVGQRDTCNTGSREEGRARLAKSENDSGPDQVLVRQDPDCGGVCV